MPRVINAITANLSGKSAVLTGMIAVLFISVCGHMTGTWAAFKDQGWGARPLGMGGAFTAVANDSNATLFNPAGLAQVTQNEASFMSARLYTGLDGVEIARNYLSYVMPLNPTIGNVGASWASLTSPGLYREDTACISYGRSIDQWVNVRNVNMSAGLNLKFLRNEYTLDEYAQHDPVFEDGSQVNAFTGDIGLWAAMPEYGVSAGYMSKNITSPDIGLKSSEHVPNENILGLAYYNERLPYAQLPYFTGALDLVNRKNEWDLRVGVETWLSEGKFAIRMGGSSTEITFGLGYEIALSAQTKFILDYALGWPLEVEQTSGTHQLGLSLRFP